MHFLNGPNKAGIYLAELGTIFPSNFVPTHVDFPAGGVVVRRDVNLFNYYYRPPLHSSYEISLFLVTTLQQVCLLLNVN